LEFFRSGKRKLRSPEQPINDRKFPKKESEKVESSSADADESHSEEDEKPVKPGLTRHKKLPVTVPLTTVTALIKCQPEQRQQEVEHDEVDFHPATDKSSTLLHSFAGNQTI
jgi:hypothetical protein